MKFVELLLTRFGPFTDRRLAFDIDRPLTVVHGANEAGKSSALAAMIDVLFGIEQHTRFNFVHKYGVMRLGATVIDRRGTPLSFRRRKGTQKTLLDVRDEPLGDDALLPFIGTANRALFVDAFGLDQPRLREGARRLIADDGDVGQSLLAAAPGMSELGNTRKALDAEAEALFTSRKVGSKPFYIAVARHAAAHRQVKDCALLVDQVEAAQITDRNAAQRLADLEQERIGLRKERAKVDRHRRLVPALRRIETHVATLAELGEVPNLPADFDRRREAAATDLNAAVRERGVADMNERALVDELAKLTVPHALLEREADIERASEARPSLEKAAQDLPRRMAEIDRDRKRLDEVARRLGLTGADEVLRRQPTAPAIARVRELLDQSLKLRTTLEALRSQHDVATADGKRVRTELDALGEASDPQSVARRLTDLTTKIAATAKRADFEAEVQRCERLLATALARLSPSVASLDRLVAMTPPTQATIERFDTSLRKASDAVERILDQQRQTRDSLAAADQRLRELAVEGEVPTTDAIDAARDERSGVWAAVRTAITGGVVIDRVTGADLSKRHEDATSRADRLVDRRASEATRVAHHSTAVVAREKATEETKRLDEALSVRRAGVTTLQEEWQRAWASADFESLPPHEMLTFNARRDEVLRLREELATSHTKIERADREAHELRVLSEEFARELGLAVTPNDAIDRLLRRSRDVVDERSTRWGEARGRLERIAEIERVHATTTQKIERARGDEEGWSEAWSQAVIGLGLTESAGVAEAKAALEAWTEVPALAQSLTDLEHRVSRIHADRDAFDRTITSLASDLGLDPTVETTTRIAGELRRSLDAAIKVRDQNADLEGRLRRARGAKNSADDKQRQSQAALDDLLRIAGAESTEMLREIIAKARQRDDIRGRLHAERAELAKDAAGADEAALRSELGDSDPDALAAAVAHLEDRDTRLDVEIGKARDDALNAHTARVQLESRDGAERASQDAQAALADLSDIVEEWTVLRAASKLLTATIEEYRRRHENPVLSRAQEVFRALTVGRFERLAVELDESDDKPRLFAVRTGGERVAIEGMSEGTADQLFLALRIATIEEYATRSEPLPLVCDDLFVSFDDTRTIAGLRVLADLGATTQTILFTHHARVVDAARETLGERVHVLDIGAS